MPITVTVNLITSGRLRARPMPSLQVQHIRQQKRQLQTLRRVQSWVAVGVIPVRQRLARNRHRPADALVTPFVAPPALHKLQAYLPPHRRRRTGQGVEADGGVGGVEQAIERAAAGVHAFGHRDPNQLLGLSFCAFIASPS